MQVFWFLPTHGDSRYLGTGEGARQVDHDYLRQVAGALSNTVLVWAVAVVPDFTDGFRLAMAITAAATVVMVVVFARQARLDRAGA